MAGAYLAICAAAVVYFFVEPYQKGYREYSKIVALLLAAPWSLYYEGLLRGTPDLITNILFSALVLASIALNAFFIWALSFIIAKAISHVGKKGVWVG